MNCWPRSLVRQGIPLGFCIDVIITYLCNLRMGQSRNNVYSIGLYDVNVIHIHTEPNVLKCNVIIDYHSYTFIKRE